MGGKASSNYQNFESFVRENQNDFFNELSHLNKKHKEEAIGQSMIKTLQSLKYLIISAEKLQTTQHVWNKIDFSVCIMDLDNMPIQINHYMKYTFKSFSFGIIHLDLTTCYHIIFFLNKSKVYLSIQEFLKRILLASNTNDNNLSSLIVSRKTKFAASPLKLSFPNPFLEQSIEPELLQSSSCAFFQKSQSDNEFSSDSYHYAKNQENTNTKKSFQNFSFLRQPNINNENSDQESFSLIEDENESDNNDKLKSDPIIIEQTPKVKKSDTYNKKKLSNASTKLKIKSNQLRKKIYKPNKQFTLNIEKEEKDDYSYYSDDNKKLTKLSKKSPSPYMSKNNKVDTKKSETDHLSSLFNFSTAELPSTTNQNKNNDICIDFNDKSSSTNFMPQYKNWLPKNDDIVKPRRKRRKNLPSAQKNIKKEQFSPTRSKNKSVHINLTSDFDKSIHLNENKTKRAASSPRKRQKKKNVKSSPKKRQQKTNSKINNNSNNNINALGALASDFEMNSMISKQQPMMSFHHDFSSSYEEDKSSVIEINKKSNSKPINQSLINNTSRNIKEDNSNINEFDNSMVINSYQKKTKIRKRKNKIQSQERNQNEISNNFSFDLKANQQSDDEMNQNLQLRIPRVFEKRSMASASEIKLGHLASDFELSASSVIRNDIIYRNQNSNSLIIKQNQNENSKDKNLKSSKDLGQLANDFENSGSNLLNKSQKSVKKNKKRQNNGIQTPKTFDINDTSSQNINRNRNKRSIQAKRNRRKQNQQNTLDPELSKPKDSFDTNYSSNKNNTIKFQNPKQSIPQKIKNENNQLELSNTSLGHLNSDFDISNTSNNKNDFFKQNRNSPDKNQSPTINKLHKNQSKLANNSVNEINYDQNMNDFPKQNHHRKINMPQRRRNNQNKDKELAKDKNKTLKQNDNPNILRDDIHPNRDLGRLTSDFSSNI